MSRNKKASLLALVAIAFAIPVARPDVQIAAAQARPMPGGLVEIYFVLRNDTPRALELIKAASPTARFIELKQRSYGADNVARIWPVAKLEIAPGTEARFLADGRFFLLSGVEPDPRPGQRLPLTLIFEDEAPITVNAIVTTPR